MSFDEWDSALRPKVSGSWNLHQVLGSDLDFFVLLSSTVGLMGNPEQSNYAAGSTFQDALANHLASQGLNAVSLDLPVILDVGFVAEKPELMDQLRSLGWSYMSQDELRAVLDYCCQRPAQPQSLAHPHIVPRFWLPQETAADGVLLPSWRNDPLFCHLRHQDIRSSSSDSRSTETKREVKYAILLAATSSMMEVERIVLDALLVKLSRVLSVDVADLDPTKPLHAYGVDSLVAVELRAWLGKELGADLSVFDMTSKPSIKALGILAAVKSTLLPNFGGN
jgi:aryl carrier-like protein